jgi:hypothetical protein
MSGRCCSPMAARSAKPRFTSSSTGATRRSSSALVATVVPSRTSSTRPSLRGCSAARPSTSRMAATAGSLGGVGSPGAPKSAKATSGAALSAPLATDRRRSESTLRTTREPSGAWPTRSVKVPPRSIQNRQPPRPPSEPDGAMAVVGVDGDLGVIIAQGPCARNQTAGALSAPSSINSVRFAALSGYPSASRLRSMSTYRRKGWA